MPTEGPVRPLTLVGPRAAPDTGGATAVMNKRTLLLMSHAMERTFDAAGRTDGPGLVVGLFQRREYFDAEAQRYGDLARAGHTVLVAFTGSVEGLPDGVRAVQLDPADPRAQYWVLVLARGTFAGALVATDRRELDRAETTLQGSRNFDATWTFRRPVAAAQARSVLEQMAQELPSDVLQTAMARLQESCAIEVTEAEAQLASATEHLVDALETGGRRYRRLQRRLQAASSKAERDQLTGLHNRHYLERFLGSQATPADLLVMLVDVDDLKTVNDTHGHGAGDAVLAAVARALLAVSREGDVVVRWGGDEFMVLIPDPGPGTPEHLLRIGQRLAHAVSQAHPEGAWSHLDLSVSVGLSFASSTRLPLERLDAALYAVKRAGKGHARLAPTSVEPSRPAASR